MMSSESTLRIKAALLSIPRGRVASYGAVGRAAGLQNGARQVVRILHSSASAEGLPWHRVLRIDGSIALPAGEGFELQRTLLEAEGVEVEKGGRVDLRRFGYDFGAPENQAGAKPGRSPRQVKKNARPSSPGSRSPSRPRPPRTRG